jgi:hypothetical protein
MAMGTEVATQPADSQAGKARKGRRVPILPIVVLLVIIGGFAFLLVFRSQPSEQVRRLIDKQLKLSTGGRFDQLWEQTLSPGLKQACPLDAFTGSLNQIRASQPDFWTLIQYRDIHVTVTGNRAAVTYVITYNGTPIESATPENPDLYIRATQTTYGGTVTKQDQLQQLEQLRDQAIVVGKEYEKEKAQIMRHGDIRRVLSVKGQWYDEVDAHARCEG